MYLIIRMYRTILENCRRAELAGEKQLNIDEIRATNYFWLLRKSYGLPTINIYISKI